MLVAGCKKRQASQDRFRQILNRSSNINAVSSSWARSQAFCGTLSGDDTAKLHVEHTTMPPPPPQMGGLSMA